MDCAQHAAWDLWGGDCLKHQHLFAVPARALISKLLKVVKAAPLRSDKGSVSGCYLTSPNFCLVALFLKFCVMLRGCCSFVERGLKRIFRITGKFPPSANTY